MDRRVCEVHPQIKTRWTYKGVEAEIMYYCSVCEKDLTEDEAVADPLGLGFMCPKCGSQIIESYVCPVHGTDAPDGYGNCAKC